MSETDFRLWEEEYQKDYPNSFLGVDDWWNQSQPDRGHIVHPSIRDCAEETRRQAERYIKQAEVYRESVTMRNAETQRMLRQAELYMARLVPERRVSRWRRFCALMRRGFRRFVQVVKFIVRLLNNPPSL